MENQNLDVKKFLKNKRYKSEISKYNYQKFSELIKKYNDNKTSVKIVGEILEEFNTKLYNIKGKICEWIKTKLNKNNTTPTIRFNLQFKLKDNENGVIYHVKINRVNAELCENFKKFEKSHIYITNMKINVTKGEVLFSNSFQTKIFIDKSDFSIINKDYSIDITQNNEEEFLDNCDMNGLNDLLTKLDIKHHDYSDFLRKDIGQIIFDLSNIGNLLSKSNKDINLYGFISHIKVEDFKKVITVTSLLDSNCIRIYFYNKCYLDLREKMIVYIKKACVQVNKGVDIILEIVDDKSIEALQIINEEEFKKIKKFRYDSKRNYNFLIDLIQPVIIRNINKYYLKIKRLYKVSCYIDENNKSDYPELKNIRFKAKCLVDDGTLEAILIFSDIYVYRLFKIDSISIEEIYKLAKMNNNNYVIHDFLNIKNNSLLKVNYYELDDLTVFAVPFCSTAHKDLFNKAYTPCYDKSNSNENFSGRNNDVIFINGETGKDQNKEEISVPKPCIKAIHINKTN